jgi:acyl-CoA dehydrogenase
MTDILLSFLSFCSDIYLINPLFAIGGSVFLFFMFAYLRMPLVSHSFIFMFLLAYLNFSVGIILFCLFFNILFLIKPFRRVFITKNVMKALRAKKILPQISETEQTALDAGNVWIENEFFSGRPDFKRIYSQPFPSLTQEETDFLNNEVEQVCEMVRDFDVFQNKDLPENVWNFLKEKRFFAMIIPKQYGGLEFSPIAQSTIVAKLATRSQVLSITTMVPNSLGPGELLLKYGTQIQKDYYLPRLADGREVPAFGLTEPVAGSDATSIKANGVVFKGRDGSLKIRLNFHKRYITLGGVATVIGLAFHLEDPANLLPAGVKTGITCALLKGDATGLKRGRRHMPLYVPFVNSPLWGENVEIEVTDVIGGLDGCGHGWKMLMECLAVGRGISLPAISAGGAQLVTRYISAYSQIRTQFKLPIAKFEGIEEVLAEIYGLNYAVDSMRKCIAGAIGDGNKPSVANAIAKYHATEMYRKIINHGMDVAGGAGICVGPNNVLAHGYMGTPIAITVEGANIMTRTLMQFGQGVIRCHPYVYAEVQGLLHDDLEKFDTAFWSHVSHFISNRVRMIFMGLTRGNLHRRVAKNRLIAKIEKKIAWASCTFAFMSDLALMTYGGNLKRKEKLSGRFADILSYLLIVTCAVNRFKAENYENPELLEWTYKHYFYKIDTKLWEIYQNMDGSIILRFGCKIIGFFSRMNKFTCKPSDKLTHLIVKSVHENQALRDKLTDAIFISESEEDILCDMELVLQLNKSIEAVVKKIKLAKTEPLDALKDKIINEEEYSMIKLFEELKTKVIQVNDFSLDTIFGKNKE